MRVLILNWRDIRSPRGGGAERVTHEVALRLVKRGHEVTWLSSASDGLPASDVIDGVSVLRRGSEATTRLYAPSLARQIPHDVVLEEINTLPYLAPLWSRVPVLLYMNQLAREVWWYEAPFPVAGLGWLSEPIYLRAYRGCDAVTISNSSRDDLRRLGIRGTISVAPMASDIARVEVLGGKAMTGSLIAVGRLTPSKRYGHAIEALAELRVHRPAATLTLVGEGRSRAQLERLANRKGLGDVVSFAGRVSEEAKNQLLRTSDILLGTSVREGWGLTVTEAAAQGTPSVVYNIPGFRDAVINGRTGLITEPNPSSLAVGVRALLADPMLYERVRVGAWESFGWETYEGAANTFERALAMLLGSR